MAGWFHGKSDRNMDDLEVPWIGNLREYSSNRQIAIFSHGTSMASINCDASKPHFLLKKCWLKSWKASCGHIADLSARRAVHCEAGQGQVTNQRGDQRSIKMGMGCNPFNANIYIHMYVYIYIYIYLYTYIYIFFGFGVHQVLINIDQPLSILKQEPRQQKHGFHLIHQRYSTLPN
jgi:hypothetical protein